VIIQGINCEAIVGSRGGTNQNTEVGSAVRFIPGRLYRMPGLTHLDFGVYHFR